MRTRKPAARDARRTERQIRPAGRPTKQLPAEIESELADLVAATGCELIHAEWKGGTLRLFIDRESSGVSLADCEHVAKLASALLDVLDFGNGRYLLEVSSPGLDRELHRPRDYARFLGRLVRVTYETPPAAAPGPRRVPSAGEVTLIDDRTGERLTLKLETIRLAKLEVEL